MTPAPAQLWVYRARAVRVVDGDTLDVVIDCGFHGYRTERLRLLGVNTPELKGETRAAGEDAKAFVQDWLAAAGDGDWPLVIRTEQADAFGRYLAVVWAANGGACLNDALLAEGLAVPFDG